MTDEMSRYDSNVKDIIDGRHGYGKGSVEAHVVSSGLIWYGNPGISASIGGWIQMTWTLFQGGAPISTLRKYWAHTEEEDSRRVWYYAIEMDDKLHVVGGANEMGGGGNEARKIAEAYLKIYHMPVLERPLTDLLDVLVVEVT